MASLVEQTVLESLPSWSNCIAFEPESDPLWTGDFTPQLVSAAVGSVLPLDAINDIGGILFADEDTLLRFDESAGYVRFVARDRAFDPDTSPQTLANEGTVQNLTSGLLQQIGVPMDEVGAIRTAPIMMNVDDEDGSSTMYTRETLVDIQREIDGIPVVRSKVRIVVSNAGEIARLLLEWPDFHFAEGLNGIERSPQQVADEIIAFVLQKSGGLTVPEIRQELVYFPTGPLYASEYVPAVKVVVHGLDDEASSMTFVPVVE